MRALLTIQVYFHLGEYDEALSFALGAGDLLNLSAKTEFVETIICTPPSFANTNISQMCGQVHRDTDPSA